VDFPQLLCCCEKQNTAGRTTCITTNGEGSGSTGILRAHSNQSVDARSHGAANSEADQLGQRHPPHQRPFPRACTTSSFRSQSAEDDRTTACALETTKKQRNNSSDKSGAFSVTAPAHERTNRYNGEEPNRRRALPLAQYRVEWFPHRQIRPCKITACPSPSSSRSQQTPLFLLLGHSLSGTARQC
jgi:hypothetical protein